MNEKIKDKDADKAPKEKRELEEGLEDTFPASDPVSSTRPGEGKPETKEKTPGTR